MFKIDYYAYSNKLRCCHPGEKTAFSLLTMAVCLAFPYPVVSLAVILVMAAAVTLAAGIPWRVYIKLMSLPLFFLILGVAAIAISVSRHSASLYGIAIGSVTVGVTFRDLDTALIVFGKSLGAVSCLYFLSLTTPVVETISVLKKARFPAVFIELMNLVYRFIFVVMETASRIYVAQSSRWGYASFKTSFYSLGQLVSTVFIKSYHRSRELHTALVSRCYNGELNVIEPGYRISVKNVVVIASIEMILLIIALYTAGVH